MIYISAIGMLNALGSNLPQIASNLSAARAPGMQRRTGWLQQGQSLVVGEVSDPLPAIPAAFAAHYSRNNQLLLAALAQIQPQVTAAIARYGADRLAVVLGTSTSGLDEADRYVNGLPARTPASHYHYYQQELGDPSRFLSAFLQLNNVAFTLSTACSSSARAIISGCRLLQADLADAAIVGGADSLSRMPVNGFYSLDSLSTERCQPFSRDRNGITIGEGAALMLLSKEPQPLAIYGTGESSDAWHISAPHPEGSGACAAINQALHQAGVSASQVGYINLHGTATPLNDQIEAQVIHRLFGTQTPCSSTKHLTGHLLGAAGISEAALCALILQHQLLLPAQDFSRSPLDERLPACGLLQQPAPLSRPLILSNSFAFGGNNASILIGSA